MTRSLFLLLVLSLLACPLWAQSAPEFEADAVTVLSDTPGKSRVDVYTRIAYADLQFVQRQGGFEARYEVNASVYVLDKKKHPQALVLNRSWERRLRVPSFAATRQDTLYDFTMESLELQPGMYVIKLELTDGISRVSSTRDVAIRVRDLDKPVALSDLLIIDAYDVEHRTITPNVGSVVGTDEPSLKLFYEIYAEKAQLVRIAYEVFRERAGAERPFWQALLGIHKPRELPGAEISYTAVDLLPILKGRNPATITIPLKQFRPGTYRVRVLVEDPEGRLLDVSERYFTTRWMGIEDQLKHLDQAIDQLVYIAKDKEIRYIKEADSYQEKWRRFQEFWKKRDPTPGTRRNERMEEYYYRVAYANKKFGYFQDGWLTDRGEVFIRFGEPDAIERHPFNFDTKPYEIWYYHALGRQFIFVDKTGFGDYELLVPIWDERTRMR